MKVVHTNTMEWSAALTKGPYANRRKQLGGERMPCSVWELAPGKKSFPLHAHLVTEEALFVLSGTAKLRTGEGLTPLGPGDYVSFPAGGPAHQLVNDGSEPFVYLGMSATQGVDVVEYPDSDKVASAIGTPGSTAGAKRYIFKKKDQADYFDGEL